MNFLESRKRNKRGEIKVLLHSGERLTINPDSIIGVEENIGEPIYVIDEEINDTGFTRHVRVIGRQDNQLLVIHTKHSSYIVNYEWYKRVTRKLNKGKDDQNTTPHLP